MSEAQFERRIERLEDIEAIRRLKWRYALAADDRTAGRVNVDDALQLFAADAVLEDNRHGRAAGRDEIRALLLALGEQADWSLHFLQDTGIEIAADRATARGRWYLLEVARMKSPRSGRPEQVWIAGVYDDRFVRVDGQWLFSAVKLDVQRIVGETGVWD